MSKNNKTYTTAGKGTPETKKVNIIKLREKVIVTVVLLLFTAVLLTGTILYVNHEDPVYTEITNTPDKVTSSSASIPNGGFDFAITSDENKLGYPLIAKNWTLTRNDNANTVAGIVPVSDDTWDTVSKNLNGLGVNINNPGQPQNAEKNEDDDNNNVYMISNIENSYANIKNYSSFQVGSNKYKKVSIWVKTEIDENCKDVYIWLKKSSSSTTPEKSYIGINTNGEWKEYTFLIEGSDSSSTSLYIEIGIGQNSEAEGYDNAKGTVFIDDIVMTDTTKGDYLALVDSGDTTTTQSVSFYSDKERTNLADGNINNDKFEVITGTQYKEEQNAMFPFANADSSKVYKLVNDGSNKSVGSAILNDSVLNIQNITKETTEDSHYRVSFYVRTIGIKEDQGLNIYLYNKNDKSNNNQTTYFSKIRTPEDIEDDTFNGWVQYSFYIKPSNNTDFSLQLEFWLGRMINGDMLAEAVTGTVYVTDIEVNKVKLSDYSGASANSNVKKVDLTSSAFAPVGTTTLTNGSFDNYASNVQYGYPAMPSDWSAITPSKLGDVTYGIVEKGNANNSLLPTAITNNDFMAVAGDKIHELYINNNNKTSFGVSSSLISLSANSFYRITVVAKELGGKANVYLRGDIEMAMSIDASKTNYYTADKVELVNGFVQFNFYIATGEQAKSVYLMLFNGTYAEDYKLQLDTEKAQGAVVYDLADYVTMEKDAFYALSSDDNLATEQTQIFDKYDTEDAEGNAVVVGNLTAKYDNVMGIDLSNEKADTRAEDPVVEDDTDDKDDTKAEINWVNIFAALATILMIVAVFIAIFKVVRKNQVKAQKASGLDTKKK